jgi:gliding motility-associated-like protein/uncharacterized delta-60 repeat protein
MLPGQGVSIDSSYAVNGRFKGHPGIMNAMLVDDLGRTISASVNSSNKSVSVVRLNPNGAPDSSFATHGFFTHTFSRIPKFCFLKKLSSGKLLLLVADEADSTISVLKLSADGILPSCSQPAGGPYTTCFGVNGQIQIATGYGIRLADASERAQGGILMQGIYRTNLSMNNGYWGVILVEIDSLGNIRKDANAQEFTLFPAPIQQVSNAVISLSDQKVLLPLSTYDNGNFGLRLVRLNSDRSIDPSFGNFGYQSLPILSEHDLLVTSYVYKNGLITVIGYTYNTNSVQAPFIFQVNEDGDFTSMSFNSSPLMNFFSATQTEYWFGLEVLPNQEILFSGMGSGRWFITRLSAEGSIKQNFGNNGFYLLPTGIIGRSLVVSSEGNVFVAGTQISAQNDPVVYKLAAEDKGPLIRFNQYVRLPGLQSLSCEMRRVSLQSVSTENQIQSFTLLSGQASIDDSILQVEGPGWIELEVRAAANGMLAAADTIWRIDASSYFDCEFAVFNFVSPDSDGLNEYFEVQIPKQRPCQLWIYDRWSRLVFESQEYLNDWNGQHLPAGNYTYELVYFDLEEIHKRGIIHLVK